MNQFHQAKGYTIRGRFEFFRKFTEIFAAKSAPPVSLTPVEYGKNLLVHSQMSATSINNTSGTLAKFATFVVEPGVAP
jgi:uncharacterized membrane protein